MNFPRRADFDHQPLVGFFEPEADQGEVTRQYFGLHLEGTYFYGIFRDAEGRSYAVIRKLMGYSTRDMAIMASDDTGLRLDRRSLQALMGAKVERNLIDGYDVTQGGSQSRGQFFETRLGDQDFSWVENGPDGTILDVRGPIAAPGFQVFVPWRTADDEPGPTGEPGSLFYTSTLWKAEGTIFGEPVTGFFAVDQDYLPHGVGWNNSAVWKRLQGGWNVFANEYDDGTVEWGHMSIGADRFRFVAAATLDGTSVNSTEVEATVEWADDEFVRRIVFDIPGDDPWEFICDDNGRMVDFSAARPGWSGHAGVLRRVGEKRSLVRHWAWQEIFPERVRPREQEA